MSTPIFIADAFVTDAAFTGNPAAVCVLPEGGVHDLAADDRKLAIAAEMHLSETAFVAPVQDAEFPSTWDLRWFTPGSEVELCGHATMAAAHSLRERGLTPTESPITFRTRFRGDLLATRRDGREAIRLPVAPLEDVDAVPGLIEAMGVEPKRIVRTLENDLVLVLEDPAAIMACRPDMRALESIEARGMAITALATEAESDGARVVSRYFAPGVSVPEDPVTGSLHSSLGLLWSPELGPRFLARQASDRGGLVAVDASNAGEGVVEISGRVRMTVVGAFVA